MVHASLRSHRLLLPLGGNKGFMSKKTGWIITAIVAPIIAGVIVDRLKIVDFSAMFIKAFEWIKSLLSGELAFSLPIWGWLLVLAAIPLVYFSIKSIYKRINSNDPYESYKNDSFLGISWSWDYYLQDVIENTLLPLCPKCEFELQPYQASGFNAVNHVGYICQKCGWKKEFEATHNQVILSVIKSIEHKIRTHYKKAS